MYLESGKRSLLGQVSGLRFHIEHIVARQHGGSDESSNLRLRQHLLRLGLLKE